VGIIAYVRQHTPWSIYLPELGRGDVAPTSRGDGIIARIETRAIARRVAHIGLPVVDVSGGRHIRSFPWVETDDAAIAKHARSIC
jgi:LacI family transcriptional regulator